MMTAFEFTPGVVTLSSERRKLSVEAKISAFSVGFKYIPAKTGRMAPSAVEKRVFSIATFRSLDSIVRGECFTSDGMTGNFSALAHLNFVSLDFVVNLRLPPFSRSTVTSSSWTSAIYDVRNFDEMVNFHSTSTSTHSSMIYSIAISRLFPVTMSFLNPASIRIFSRMGVRLLAHVA